MRRLVLIGGAAPVGVLTGLVAWLIAGGASASLQRVDMLQAKLSSITIPQATSRAAIRSDLNVSAAPLFALTTGPSAVREPSIRLDGISISRRRAAALVAVDGALSSWMTVGDSRDGVTLQAVSSTKITIETAVGIRDLSLGDQTAASAPAQAAQASPAATTAESDRPPPGYRMPPAPADAPAQ